LPFVALLSGLVGLPLLALPLAALERRRLALLGLPVPDSPHRTPRPGLGAWLRLRYGEGATWRELAYVLLMATVLGVVDALVALAVGASALAVIAPPLEPRSTGPMWGARFGFAVLLVLALYLALLVAAGRAAIVRALIGGEVELAVRELTRSRARLVDAFEVERRRIERDLHDGAQQRLVALTMTLGLAELELGDAPGPARELVGQARVHADAALTELRELVRGIHPQALADHGLVAAVAELADRSPVPVALAVDLDRRLPSTVESTGYFVIAEALANAAKHAQAERVDVAAHLATGATLAGGAGATLVVEVRDDGRGGADPAAGTGLAGLADRVGAIGGTLTLSSPLGGPTVLRLEVPCSGL
jgi:signal transduction histidine kinase